MVRFDIQKFIFITVALTLMVMFTYFLCLAAIFIMHDVSVFYGSVQSLYLKLEFCLFCRSSQHDNKEFVDYRTFSPKDLAKSVLSEGGWSNVVVSCPLDD